MEQKAYFFVMKIAHHRSGETIGKVTGVVFADNEEDAKKKASDFGNDRTSELEVFEVGLEVGLEGYRYTVYKSCM